MRLPDVSDGQAPLDHPTSEGDTLSDLVPITAELTAYAPNSAVCQTTGTTYDGTLTDERPYGLAADRRLPIGTVVYIPAGIGVLDRVRAFDRSFVADDRGGALEHHGGGPIRLDLRVKDEAWAKRFGRRIITVYIERD